MLITVTAKGVTLPASLKEAAERKLVKLERLLRKIDSVDITCSRERQWQVVEIMVNANGLLIRGQDRAADVRSALDSLLDKLERRVKKSRSKLIQRYREAPDTRPAWEEGEEGIGLGDDQLAQDDQAIVRSKRFSLKPMSPDEAAAQMELLGHDFYVFANSETNQVNVIYRRKSGNYGLIEPEF